MITNPISCCFAFLAVLGAAHAQNVVATSSSGQATPLVPHPAMVAYVVSNSNNFASAAGGKVIGTVAASAVPIPVVGGLIADQAVGRIVKVFHKPKLIKGFNVAFVQGLSAGTALQKGAMSFTVPAQLLQGTSPALQGSSPLLLRLKPSVKDSARIVRSVHLSTKITGSAINPPAPEILDIDQTIIACHLETRNGAAVLIPDSPLESGEYAIVLVSVQPDKVPVAGAVLWDFRLL